MGSLMALPALDVKTPQQPDILQKYGQLQQLRAMQQEQQQRAAMAPLQQQEAQQSIQSGQLGIQQQQQALKDQQAVTAAMQQWDGKDLNDLAPLVLKNGGSGQAVIGLKQKQLDIQAKAAETFKNQADGGKAQVDALKTRNDLLAGALSPLTDPTKVPDAQLPQALTSAVQSLTSQGTLTPQDAQAAAQLAQSSDPNAIRTGLKEFINSHQALSQTIENAQKTAQIASEQSTTAKNQAESQFYAQNGGAPGVPAEMMQQSDWLKKNPGKGPSDYKLWVMRNSPTAMVMNNQLAGPKNDDALDFAANNYRQTGQMPAGFARSPQTTTAIIQRAAQLDQQQGGAGIAANKATLGSLTDALKKLQTNASQVSAFEQTAEKNMNLLQQTAQKIPDLGSRFANVPVRMLNANMLGTDNMAAFKTALATAQTEAAKVLNSSNATGTLSDSSRHELQDIIDGNMPYSALVASLNTLKQDMHNRNDSNQQAISDLQNRIKGGGAPQSQAPAGKPVGTTNKPDGVYDLNGKHYTVRGGQVYE